MERTPSAKAAGLMLILTILLTSLVLLGPTMYASLTGQEAETGSSFVVLKIGTTEFNDYVEKFKETHGREWTTKDQVSATYNGGLVMIGIFGIGFGIFTALWTIWDFTDWRAMCREYKQDNKHDRNIPQPRTWKKQLIRSGICLAFAIGFANIYRLIPWLAQPGNNQKLWQK